MDMRIRHLRVAIIPATLAVVAPVLPAAAQGAAPDVAPPVAMAEQAVAFSPGAPTKPSVSPLASPALAPVALQRPVDSTPPAPVPRAVRGPNVALIGVGGAALIIGLLVGGNAGAAVAVGGGVIGLVGIYRMLR